MKYECRENEKNVTRKYPIALTYRLLSPEELAEQKKKAEEARAAAAKAAEPKSFDPGERGRLLRELKSTDTNRIKTAADRLAKAPVDDHPADISKALALLLRHSDEGVQQSAAKALVVWATPEAENALIKASQSENVFLRNPAIEALGNLKSAKAAEAVAAQMYRQNSRREASKALKAMGPIAEDATIDCLNDRDMWVRAESCLVLQEIGGKKSLQALRDMSLKLVGNAPREASKAISAIELRLESEPDAAAAQEDAKAKPANPAGSTSAEPSAGLRIWHDASSTFSVEAVMLSQQDGNVVLQKKDGKTVRVAIEKLSPADKKYVAEHADDTPSKAENPFQ
jgi:HEAT repeat protein